MKMQVCLSRAGKSTLSLLKVHWPVLILIAISILLLSRSLFQTWTGMYQAAEWPTSAMNLVRHGWWCSGGLGDFITGEHCPVNPYPYFTQPPMNRNLMALSFAVFGFHEWAGRLPAILLSTGVIALIYVLGVQTHSRLTGFCGAVFAMATPVFQFFGRHTEHDQPALFFSMFVCVLYLAWTQRRSFWLFRLMILSCWMAQFSAWAGHLLAPCLIMHFVLFERKQGESFRDILWLAAGWLFGSFLTVSYLLWASGMPPMTLYDRFVFRSRGVSGESFILWEYYLRLYHLTGRYYTPALRFLAACGFLVLLNDLLHRRRGKLAAFLPFLTLWGWSHCIALRQDLIWHDFRIIYLFPASGLLVAFLLDRATSAIPGYRKPLAQGLLFLLLLAWVNQQAMPRTNEAYEFRGRITGRNLEGLRTAGRLVREKPQWAALLSRGVPMLSSVAAPTTYMGFVWYGDVPWIQTCTVDEFEQSRSAGPIIPLFLADQDCTPELWVYVQEHFRTMMVDSYLIAFLDEPSNSQNRSLPETYLANLEDCLYLVGAHVEHAKMQEPGLRDRIHRWFHSAVDAERPASLSRTAVVTLHWYVARLPPMNPNSHSFIYLSANRYGHPHTFVLFPDFMSKRIPFTLWKPGGIYAETFTITLQEAVEPGIFALKAGFYDFTAERFLKCKQSSGELVDSYVIGNLTLADNTGQIPDPMSAPLPAGVRAMQEEFTQDKWVFKIGIPNNSMDEIESMRQRFGIQPGKEGMVVDLNSKPPPEAQMTPYWRGRGAGGSDKPLEIRYTLDQSQDLTLILGTAALTENAQERFAVRLDNSQWTAAFRNRPLGTFIKKGGEYEIFRMRIPKEWTVPGSNTILINIPDTPARSRDLTGWRQWIGWFFPDWDFLLGENAEPCDGMITFDFIALEKAG